MDSGWSVTASAEREDVGLRVRSSKGRHQGAVANLAVLTDELVHASAVESPVSLFVNVDPSASTGRLAIEGHSERDRFCRLAREHQVGVTCVEPRGNTPVTFVQYGFLCFDRPMTRKSPLIRS